MATLYKVLLNGRSFHGGDMVWSLPKDGKPGDWHEVDFDPVLCERGLHLTSVPEAWWKEGASLFEVEAQGVVGDASTTTKVAAKRVRLLREVDPNQYARARGINVLRGTADLGSGDGYGDGSGSWNGSGYGDGSGYGYGSDIVKASQ